MVVELGRIYVHACAPPIQDRTAVVCGIRYVVLHHAGAAAARRHRPVQDATLPGLGDQIHGSLQA